MKKSVQVTSKTFATVSSSTLYGPLVTRLSHYFDGGNMDFIPYFPTPKTKEFASHKMFSIDF